MSRNTNERLYQSVTPIFDAPRGWRMSIARMRMGMDQAKCGELLGVSQSQISNLEKGKVVVLQTPFTMARFIAVFGKDANYILFGTGGIDKHYENIIRKNYWELKLKINRKKGQ